VLRAGGDGDEVSGSQKVKEPVPITAIAADSGVASAGAALGGSKALLRTFLAVPLASAIALAVHCLVSKNEPPIETHSYSLFLGVIMGVAIAAVAVQPF
jgi:hypothetical protein